MSVGFDRTKPASGTAASSAEMRTNFEGIASHHAGPTAPADPIEGMTWLDTSSASNHILKIYTDRSGDLAWETLITGVNTATPSVAAAPSIYTHTQGAAAATWNITHNLNRKLIGIMVLDGSGVQLFPNSVTVVNDNSVTLTFASAVDGTANVG